MCMMSRTFWGTIIGTLWQSAVASTLKSTSIYMEVKPEKYRRLPLLVCWNMKCTYNNNNNNIFKEPLCLWAIGPLSWLMINWVGLTLIVEKSCVKGMPLLWVLLVMSDLVLLHLKLWGKLVRVVVFFTTNLSFKYYALN